MTKKYQSRNVNPNRDLEGKFTFCSELTQRQRDMILEMLNNGGNKTEACKTLGIPRSTLYNWLDNPFFMDAYKKSCELLYKESLHDALKNIKGLMRSKDTRTALRASENILKLNGYLDAKLDVTQKPQEITISLEPDIAKAIDNTGVDEDSTNE